MTDQLRMKLKSRSAQWEVSEGALVRIALDLFLERDLPKPGKYYLEGASFAGEASEERRLEIWKELVLKNL